MTDAEKRMRLQRLTHEYYVELQRYQFNICDRSYRTFAVLGDVRNWYEVAAPFADRGCPIDVRHTFKDLGYHSWTWFTAAEIWGIDQELLDFASEIANFQDLACKVSLRFPGMEIRFVIGFDR